MNNENKKYGICQVCGRTVKLTKKGKIVRHGFVFQNNDCYGVGFLPYSENNDGLLFAIQSEIQIIKMHQEKINNGENTFSVLSGLKGQRKYYPRDKEIKKAERNIQNYKQRINERGVA